MRLSGQPSAPKFSRFHRFCATDLPPKYEVMVAATSSAFQCISSAFKVSGVRMPMYCQCTIINILPMYYSNQQLADGGNAPQRFQCPTMQPARIGSAVPPPTQTVHPMAAHTLGHRRCRRRLYAAMPVFCGGTNSLPRRLSEVQVQVQVQVHIQIQIQTFTRATLVRWNATGRPVSCGRWQWADLLTLFLLVTCLD